jgi:trimethylamine--corrinoid protein Co-methyltransferase
MTQGERPRLRVLQKEETRRTHETVLRILREIGLAIHDAETRSRLKALGCRETGDGFLRFSEELVHQALSTAPQRMVLYNREGHVALDTGDTIPRFSPGLGCLNVLDYRTDTHRPCVVQDIVDTARVCERLPRIDLVFSLGDPSDVPPQEEALETVRALVEHTSKPVGFVAHDEIESAQVWTHLAEVAGGWNALSERPFALELTGPTSPLRIGEEACRRLRAAAKRRLPVVCFPGAIPGATAPMTLMGALSQFAAESLGGIVIHQMEEPGAPVVSGAGILPMDMRSGGICYGGPEYIWVCLASADYLSDLGIPSWTGSGCTDSHTVDSQAAAEAGMNIMASVFAGTALTHNFGYLSSGKTGSLEMLVLCEELAGMAGRVTAETRVDEETLAFDAIDRAGKTNSYLTDEHTLRHVRAEMWAPSLFQRISLNRWQESGSKTMRERIRDKLRSLLEE